VIALRMLLSAPVYICVAVALAFRKSNNQLTMKELLAIGGLGIVSYYIFSGSFINSLTNTPRIRQHRRLYQ
jgi:hypothetical protein